MGRVVIVRVIAARVALVVTWFGIPHPATASALQSAAVAFDYDGHHHTNTTTPTTERGPSTYADAYSAAYDAVDRESHGAPARSITWAIYIHTTYGPPAEAAQGTTRAGTTTELAQLIEGDLSPFRRWHVAANSVPRFMTRHIGDGGALVVGALAQVAGQPPTWQRAEAGARCCRRPQPSSLARRPSREALRWALPWRVT